MDNLPGVILGAYVGMRTVNNDICFQSSKRYLLEKTLVLFLTSEKCKALLHNFNKTSGYGP